MIETYDVLLLEGIKPEAAKNFREKNLLCLEISNSLGENELIKTINTYKIKILGTRAKTHITQKVIEETRENLKIIGAFCAGLNQIDLETAQKYEIPVLNDPEGGIQSVAELTIANILNLARNIPQQNQDLQNGIWKKTSQQSFEAQGKTLGLIGYGSIGKRVSGVSEAIGMKVQYFDKNPGAHPLGNAQKMETLEALLETSDFVSIHINASKENENLINKKTIKMMKEGSFLINTLRGSIIDIKALENALDKGDLGGAALDVFPVEPLENQTKLEEPLLKIKHPKLILTPHIGGSTQEAQTKIAETVSQKIMKEFLKI